MEVVQGLEEVNHYIETQMALGNWPEGSVFSGDEALIATVDVYESILLS
jgi:hypothetical protein